MDPFMQYPWMGEYRFWINGGVVVPVASRLILAGALLTSAILFGQTGIHKAKTGAQQRMREGQPLVNAIGRFSGGDRYTFKTEGSSFRVLENLNLERIATVVEDDAQAQWLISGTITEFRGANYLLITRAVLKDKRRRR